uniref:Ovule protein n=1 Tax=Mesocestoides corti TaxID=53468 RepID=A0A5K3G015_MESCO
LLLACVEEPCPSVNKTGAADSGHLSIHNPETYVRRHSSESPTLISPLIIDFFSYVSVANWLHTFLACHSSPMQQRSG